MRVGGFLRLLSIAARPREMTPTVKDTVAKDEAALTQETSGGSAVRWPERYRPGHAAVFAHNELVIPASAAAIWRTLVRAEAWPEWYPNSADIHFLSHATPDLRDRSRFRWKTFGFRITSKVLEFEAERRLAWDAHGVGVNAYHAWVLTPLTVDSTHVLTEETQTGWLARLGKLVRPGRLERMHQLWLERLAERTSQFRA